jgi:hypothetical protein
MLAIIVHPKNAEYPGDTDCESGGGLSIGENRLLWMVNASLLPRPVSDGSKNPASLWKESPS